MQHKQIHFIINKASSTQKKSHIVDLIHQKMEHPDYEIFYTEKPGDALKLSRTAVNEGVDLVVAVGGDGTVHEVGKGVIGTNTAMGILPTGSGNGLALHCGIPTDLRKALAIINNHEIQIVDTVKVNGDAFLNMAGVGFDAHISEVFSTFGRRGFFAYLWLVLKSYPKYQAKKYELIIDGEKYQREAFLISFANSSQYGNNIKISPKASLNDGLIDVVILKRFPFYAAPLFAARLLTSTSERSKYVEIIRAKEVTIQGENLQAHLDGEPFPAKEHMHLFIYPQSLKLAVPVS